MFLQGWVNRIWINESSVYGTLCNVLLKTLKMGLYVSEIDTRGWPYTSCRLYPCPNSYLSRTLRDVTVTRDFLCNTHNTNSKMAAHIDEDVFRESKRIEKITESGDFFILEYVY